MNLELDLDNDSEFEQSLEKGTSGGFTKTDDLEWVESGLYKCFTPLYTDFTKRSSLWTARSPRFLQKKTHFLPRMAIKRHKKDAARKQHPETQSHINRT